MGNFNICLKIIVIMFGIFVFGCDNDIKEEFDARLNGKWIAYIKVTLDIPIEHLPPDYINQFPDIIINEETGMVEVEVEYRMELELKNGQFEYIDNSRGIYFTNTGKITMKTTHRYWSNLNDPNWEFKWYTKDEFKTVPKSISSGVVDNIEYYSDEEINNIFSINTYDYSINGNILVFNFNGEIITFNRK